MVTGYSRNRFHAFDTFDEARDWLEKQGCPVFYFHQGPADGPRAPAQTQKYYVVTKGRVPGIYDNWE